MYTVPYLLEAGLVGPSLLQSVMLRDSDACSPSMEPEETKQNKARDQQED